LPEPVLQQVELIKKELFQTYGLKGALRSPSHITLHRPFEWREEKELQLIDTLSKFETGNPFTLHLNNFNCFAPRVIYVDVLKKAELQDLHLRLKYFVQKHLRLLNEVNDLRGFHPHVTVAFRDLRKKSFEEVWQLFKAREFSADIEVNGFSLLKLENTWEELRQFP
jgi:2'-5' RNA ligase